MYAGTAHRDRPRAGVGISQTSGIGPGERGTATAADGDETQDKRPRLQTRDRLLWIVLARVWQNWHTALVVVQPDIVVRWHRDWLRARLAPPPTRADIQDHKNVQRAKAGRDGYEEIAGEHGPGTVARIITPRDGIFMMGPPFHTRALAVERAKPERAYVPWEMMLTNKPVGREDAGRPNLGRQALDRAEHRRPEARGHLRAFRTAVMRRWRDSRSRQICTRRASRTVVRRIS